MRKTVFQISAAFVILAFVSGFASGAAAVGGPQLSQANGVASVKTDQATISVTGGDNVPFYHIQHNGSNTNYLVKFSDMQEFVDKNNDGMFQPNEAVAQGTTQFPGLGWQFSNFVTTNDSNNNIQNIDFNFTHAATSSVTGSTPMIGLYNHINVTAGNQIKFDIAVGQYTWQSTNASAKLAIKIQVAGGNLSAGTGNDLTFGNAYFNTVTSAQSNGADINVATQVSTGSSFYIIVDHFNGNFTLDPLFGVNSASSTGTSSASSSSSSGSGSSTKSAGLELLPILGGFAVLGLVMTKKRK